MNYADIKNVDVANGTGIRVSLFVSGCTRGCEGCFNKVAWDFNYGKQFTDETIDYILQLLAPEHINGLSILGGEPFEHPNQVGLLPLLRKVKATYPNKNIWCFTGYLYDNDIIDMMCKTYTETAEMLSYIDILVDGKFIQAEYNVNLKFKGSANQRTIDVKKSLEKNMVILHDFKPYSQG